MSQQKTFDLHADRPLPTYLRPEPEPVKRKGPPPRVKRLGPDEDVNKPPGPDFVWLPERGKWVHYTLAKASRVPLRKRERPEFRPDLIDESKFVVDKIRPFPEWPPICRETGLMAFDDKRAANAWLDRTGGKAWRLWDCESCEKVHFEPYPVDDSTSGKTPRIWDFLRRRGEEPHY